MGRVEETDECENVIQSRLRFHPSRRPTRPTRSRPHNHRPTTGVGDGDDEGFLLSSRSQAS